MPKAPVAFMSYVRFDDQHENGRLTEFCKRLSGEVRIQTGEEFPIFQDRNDITWGQEWRTRIKDSLDAVTFLIPIVTPGFLKSDACREEFELFLQRERDLDRRDLVLPVYYVNCPVLSDATRRDGDAVAEVLAARQFADWRELRFEPFTSPQVGRTLAAIAAQVIQAIERSASAPKAAPAPAKAGGRRRPESESNQAVPPPSLEAELDARAKETVARTAALVDPPTRVVDAMHRGDFASLSEALAAAEPGDRLLVRPGRYREGLVIDKPIEIVGDGAVGDVVIEASGADVVLFRAGMGRLANLTLRQMGDGKWYGIDITQGRLDVEGCDISSQSLACVAVRGGADPRLRRNRIHHGASAGIYVYDNGAGTFEDNDVYANGNAGVAIKTGGAPTLRRNRISENAGSGVYSYERGRGVVEDNEIFANDYAGVTASEEAMPTVRSNRIRDGKAGGIFVYDKAGGTYENNDIAGNALAGIEVKTGATPTFRGNKVHDGKTGGLFVIQDGLGVYEDNDIFRNGLSGIEVREGGAPVVRNNRVYENKQSGLHVHTKGAGTFEDNDISRNAFSGAAILSAATPRLVRNRLTDNVRYGVVVSDKGAGVFEHNVVTGNQKGAWDISADSADLITRTENTE